MYRPPKMQIPKLKERFVKVISIREPWLWAIMALGKRIENRPRRSHYRGRLYLHASKRYDKEGAAWLRERGHIIPDDLILGGIKGRVNMTDCVRITPEIMESDEFATGPFGLIFEKPEPVRFIACKGQLAIPFNADLYDLKTKQPATNLDLPLYG